MRAGNAQRPGGGRVLRPPAPGVAAPTGRSNALVHIIIQLYRPPRTTPERTIAASSAPHTQAESSPHTLRGGRRSCRSKPHGQEAAAPACPYASARRQPSCWEPPSGSPPAAAPPRHDRATQCRTPSAVHMTQLPCHPRPTTRCRRRASARVLRTP
eukprot:scaffold103335_cov60-Phaeocystis_antarctica.AAC.4